MEQSKVIGTVTLDGEPVAGATVIVRGEGGITLSERHADDNGHFELDLDTGSWSVEVRAGDLVWLERVPVSAGSMQVLPVEMDSAPRHR